MDDFLNELNFLNSEVIKSYYSNCNSNKSVNKTIENEMGKSVINTSKNCSGYLITKTTEKKDGSCIYYVKKLNYDGKYMCYYKHTDIYNKSTYYYKNGYTQPIVDPYPQPNYHIYSPSDNHLQSNCHKHQHLNHYYGDTHQPYYYGDNQPGYYYGDRKGIICDEKPFKHLNYSPSYKNPFGCESKKKCNFQKQYIYSYN